MKKSLTVFLFLFVACISQAQPTIDFNYDEEGNQANRHYIFIRPVLPGGGDTAGDAAEFRTAATASTLSSDFKEMDAVTQQDVKPFFTGDVISYYPNPVKEQMYLQWEKINNHTVSSITISASSGKRLLEIKNLENTNHHDLSFSNYPTGMYHVVLHYTNGEEKAIKIIKN